MSTGLWISIVSPIGQLDLVDHRRCRGDQLEAEFALQPLLDDLKMQQSEEAAAETEAKRHRGLRFEREARVVEPQLAHGRAQQLELGGVERIESAEDDGLGRAEARQRLGGRFPIVGDGVAHARVGDLLDRSREEADLAGAELGHFQLLRREHADAIDVVGRLGAHHADALALAHRAVDDAHQHDDAEIGIVPGVHQERLERRLGIALGRRQAGDDRLQHLGHVLPGLGGNLDGVRGIEPDHVLDLLLDLVGLGRGQVDLVQDRHDLVIVIERLIDVG